MVIVSKVVHGEPWTQIRDWTVTTDNGEKFYIKGNKKRHYWEPRYFVKVSGEMHGFFRLREAYKFIEQLGE